MGATAAQRLPLRAAQRIHDVLVQPDIGGIPALSRDGWDELRQLAARLQIVKEKGWARAVRMLSENAYYAVRRLERRTTEWLSGLPKVRPDEAVASVREIHADLLALEDEFEEFEIDLKEGTLSAVTDFITLEWVGLGRFEILLRWHDLGDSSPYEVVALDGNAAGFDSTTTHPHVRDDRLCEGDGHAAIRTALRTGRIFDFFVLVRQVLQTYNAASAYVPLERWEGRECRECGNTVSDDESTSCEQCDRDLCCECSVTCSECQRDCCSDCRGRCTACDSDVCDRCAEWCSDCNDRFCPQCLPAGMCAACQKAEKDAHETTLQTTAPVDETRPPAAASLHPVCVGEALVPA